MLLLTLYNFSTIRSYSRIKIPNISRSDFGHGIYEITFPESIYIYTSDTFAGVKYSSFRYRKNETLRSLKESNFKRRMEFYSISVR